MDDFVDFASMALGAGFGFVGLKLAPRIEKARLKRGDSGIASFVERDGELIDKELAPLLERPTRLGCATMVVRADVKGPTLFLIAFFVLMLVAGAVKDDPFRLAVGGLAFLLYLWMFVKATSALVRVAAGEKFTAKLDSLPAPTFFSSALASAKLSDGSSFVVPVRWRTVEAFRSKGNVELVLLGSPKEAGKAVFVGLRLAPSKRPRA